MKTINVTVQLVDLKHSPMT